MEESYMIVGMNIEAYNQETDNKIMKLTLQPLTTVKNKVTKTNILTNPLSLVDEIRDKKQEEYRAIVYVPCCMCYPWQENGYKIGRHIKLYLDFDNSTGGVDS